MSRRGIAAGCAGVVFVAGVLLVTARVQREGRPRRDSIGPETIVMLGDSITAEADWGVLSPEWPIANRGYAGHTTAQLLDEVDEVAPHGPRAIFILTGTNDIRDGHPPSWTVDRLGKIIDRIGHSAPETVVVLQTILPRADARQAARDANTAIRRLASERGLELLDLYVAFDDGTGALRPGDTTDGLHLAPAGYRRWAAELDVALRALPSETL